MEINRTITLGECTEESTVELIEKCTICSAGFSSKRGLLMHSKWKHTNNTKNKKKWTCNVCDSTFISLKQYRNHNNLKHRRAKSGKKIFKIYVRSE